MTSTYSDLSSEFTDISASFTAGKRYRIQCTAAGELTDTQQSRDRVACILFADDPRTPATKKADIKASVVLTLRGQPFEFTYTDGDEVHAAAPQGEWRRHRHNERPDQFKDRD